MPYYALATPECEADAAKNGFQSELIALCAKIENDQSIGTWDRFLRTPFIKKALGTFRVIAEEHSVGDDIVICLRHIFARGSAGYKRFIADPEVIGRSLSAQQLTLWLAERTTVAPSSLPPSSDAELAYLYPGNGEQFDDFVYETAEWVERIGKLDAKAIPWLHQLVID